MTIINAPYCWYCGKPLPRDNNVTVTWSCPYCGKHIDLYPYNKVPTRDIPHKLEKQGGEK